MGNVDGLCWACRLWLWLVSFDSSPMRSDRKKWTVTSVGGLRGVLHDGEQVPKSVVRTQGAPFWCYLSFLTCRCEHESSSLSHRMWVIDRKKIYYVKSEAHLSVQGASMESSTLWFPLQNLSQTLLFLTILLPKPKLPPTSPQYL